MKFARMWTVAADAAARKRLMLRIGIVQRKDSLLQCAIW